MALTADAGNKRNHRVAAIACAALVVVCLVPVVARAIAPDPPVSLNAVAGVSEPVIATLTWAESPDSSVAQYNIYIALQSGGPYRLIDSTTSTGTDFTDGVPGLRYYFRVAAANAAGEESAFATAGPVVSAWSASPHVEATASSRKCGQCHSVHQAETARLFLWEANASDSEIVCLTCHNGQNRDTSNVASGTRDSFALKSGHTIETTVTRPASVVGCDTCHELHGSSDRARRIPANSVNGTEVASAGPELCAACHTRSSDWYGPGYPSTSAPTRDATGYPVAGTWPGPETYWSSTNAHRLTPETTRSPSPGEPIRRAEGDCLYCHAAHRGRNIYDGLLATFAPSTPSSVASDQALGTYASLCFGCHGAVKPTGFTTPTVNIRQFATSSNAFAGHRIQSVGGSLPVGAPLPCYECHNPHGSKRGNGSLISDALGAGLDTSTTVGVRAFCFTCHTTSDTTRGWDSVSTSYTAVFATNTVVGLRRDGGVGGGANVLHLPATVAGHAQTDTTSCYACHGDSYVPNGNNVHDPSVVDYDIPAHTGAPLAQTITIDGTDYLPLCADCHSTELGAEHSKASASSAVAGCAACHPTPRDTLAPWDKTTCVQGGCHTTGSTAPMHASIDASHAPVAGQACYASSCHPGSETDSLAQTHTNASAVLGGSTRMSCQVCHWNGTPASRDCASCHASKVDGSHGVVTAHAFSAASDYSTTTVTGCTNSGAGCHDAESTYGSFTDYHPASGCATGACHTSPSKAAYAGNRECVSCHDGIYTGAPDVVSIAAPSPDGHYNEATHTATGLTDTVSAGGTAAATCATCHPATGLTAGMGDLYGQHQGVSVAGLPRSLTCSDCHNHSAGVGAIVDANWSSKTCTACHTTAVLAGLEQHGATAPTVAGTAGTYWATGQSCVTGGCHSTGDLHAIHKDASGCMLAGCHDATKQGAKPTDRSCGTTGTCHTAAEPHNDSLLTSAHDASAVPMAEPGSATTPLPANSAAATSCQNNPNATECHSVSDVRSLHTAVADHCTKCHTAGGPTNDCQAAGCHAGVNNDEHTATGFGTPAHHENGGIFASFATAGECAGCHDDSVAKEHSVLTANLAKPCSVCHATNYTAGTYSPAKATVTAQIAAGTITCNGCHTTSTQTAVHVQRQGTTATPGSAQFEDTWSGHRSYTTMPGSLTSIPNVQGATRTWSLPTATSWLMSGWTNSTQVVSCADCHGSITGAAGPHGASATVNIAAGYDNSYSTGALTLTNAVAMSNSSNICAKCHTTTGLGYNNVHSETEKHGGQPCIACHAKTPHAWKRPRLIGYTSDPAPYKSTQVTSIRARNNTPTGWTVTDCGACGTGTHPTIAGASLWP